MIERVKRELLPLPQRKTQSNWRGGKHYVLMLNEENYVGKNCYFPEENSDRQKYLPFTNGVNEIAYQRLAWSRR